MEGREVQSSLKLVRQHYTAFSCSDIDGLVAGLDPDVAIKVGGTMRASGRTGAIPAIHLFTVTTA